MPLDFTGLKASDVVVLSGTKAAAEVRNWLFSSQCRKPVILPWPAHLHRASCGLQKVTTFPFPTEVVRLSR